MNSNAVSTLTTAAPCGKLEVADSSHSDGSSTGKTMDRLEVTCNDGYIGGTATATCIPNGPAKSAWTGVPTCIGRYDAAKPAGCFWPHTPPLKYCLACLPVSLSLLPILSVSPSVSLSFALAQFDSRVDGFLFELPPLTLIPTGAPCGPLSRPDTDSDGLTVIVGQTNVEVTCNYNGKTSIVECRPDGIAKGKWFSMPTCDGSSKTIGIGLVSWLVHIF